MTRKAVERPLGPWWLVLALAAAAVALWWLSLRDTSQPQRFRIGMISLTAVDNAAHGGFRDALAGLGYREGQNLEFDDTGPAGSVAALESRVAQVVSRSPDLILVSSTPAALAVKRATQGRSIPVVFAPVNDPLGSGLVASLRAPAGNLTGVRLPSGDKRRLEWLRLLAPKVRRVLVPYSPGDKSSTESLGQLREVAPRLGFELLEVPVAEGGVEPLLAAWPVAAEAIFLPRDSRLEAQLELFLVACRQRRLPLSAPAIAQVEAGALYSYGFVHREIGRQAAGLADQILRGASPADLPVESAESYLAVNLKTAAEIGLTVPSHLLKQAALVIRP